MSRDIRRLNNSTEGSQSFSTGAPSSSLQEGGTFVSIENGNLAVYRKHKGIEFKNYMTRQGNQVIDRKLTTSELEYTKKFIDYRYFKHNMTDDIGTSEVFLPWQGTGEQSDMNNATTAFLVPFKMSLEKIMFRYETLSSTTANIRFKISYSYEISYKELIATKVIDVAQVQVSRVHQCVVVGNKKLYSRIFPFI